MTRVRRVYGLPVPGEGPPLWVDRCRPCGLGHADAAVAAWHKELAPATELGRGFARDPTRRDDFRRQYQDKR